MHDPELPASVLQTIEKRVKQRIRRQVIMVALTLALLFSVFMVNNTSYYAGGRYWGMAATFFFFAWVAYAFWFAYHALVERGIRREIERERAHQLQLVREGRRVKREERYTHLAGLADDREAFLDDDGELWFEDEDKPKRHLEH
jgi:predicted tellurium resistance membrane protein TerC